MDTNRSVIKLRDILSTKMSCRIFVLLQLEMTGPRAIRFELQIINYHGMMERRINMYRLTINIDFRLPPCGIALKMIGSASRCEFQGMYHIIGIINGRQYP